LQETEASLSLHSISVLQRYYRLDQSLSGRKIEYVLLLICLGVVVRMGCLGSKIVECYKQDVAHLQEIDRYVKELTEMGCVGPSMFCLYA